MLLAREILHYFSLKTSGDWEKQFKLVQNKKKVDEDEYHQIKNNCPYITLLDDEYPKYLKTINKPPLVLYYYGNIDLLKTKYRLSSIGTREPTKYQKEETSKLIYECAKHFNSDFALISGMARGLDSISMEAGIKAKAKVIAVLGSAIDNIYPKESKHIYDYCKTNGLILSEYPPNKEIEKDDFIKRNRIISGLSEVLFIGGGKNKSGSATTIRFAIENNKDILALPCNNSGDDLTNTLISEGAEVVLSSIDIINHIKNRYN